MKINREKALAAFQEYTDRYDSSRDMIRLKIEHTYRVCGLCQQIATDTDSGVCLNFLRQAFFASGSKSVFLFPDLTK